MADLLLELRRALNLDPDASVAEIRAAVNGIIADAEEKAANDPRLELRRAAEKRATTKHIGFIEALRELSEEQPALVRRVSDFYAREK